ncbi:hypothetical protein PENSTE_c038G03328 [Penicillium steckii]|uniref:C2H2-type domain-containing protein n=1 Tax=Penicillium steckii TaxID=303698 RepID=A0A1V6SJB6_9EURO|nr:hypothetical protein PENSTE_c038G03328 [Penicillium steckii]
MVNPLHQSINMPRLRERTSNLRHRQIASHSITVSPPKGFSCSYCGNSYHRKEHLTRHERSHKAQRPYTCRLCNQTFTRSDVLKRHLERHDIPHSRASRACDRCHVRKCKCDGGDPCASCSLTGAVCSRQRFREFPHLNDNNASAKRDNTLLGTNLPASSSIDNLANEGPLFTTRQGPSPDISLAEVSNHELTQAYIPGSCSPTEGNDGSSLLHHEYSGICALEFTNFGFSSLFNWDLSTDTWLVPSTELLLQQSPPLIPTFTDEDAPLAEPGSNPPDIGNSEPQPWPSTLDTLPSDKAPAELNQSTTKNNTDISVAILHGHFDQLPTLVDEANWDSLETKLHTTLNKRKGDVQALGFDNVSNTSYFDFLIGIYFARFHYSWPLLHRASFQKHLKNPLLVLSVVMVGSFLDEDTQSASIFSTLHHLLKEYLYKSLNDLTRIRSWSMPIYQALTLTVIVGFLSGHRADAIEAELFHGSLITLLRRLGLFKCNLKEGPAVDDTHSSIVQEEKTRLVITATKIDAYVSVVHNRPPNISYEEIAVFFPSPWCIWNATAEAYTKSWRDGFLSRHYQTISEVVFDIIHNESPIIPLSAQDHQLILCLIQPFIWRHVKTQKLRERFNCHSRMALGDHPFQGISPEDTSPNIQRILNRVRRHFEVLRQPRLSAGERQLQENETTVFNSLVLWHIGAIRFETDLEMIHETAGNMNLAPSEYAQAWRQLHSWACSPSGRESIWHAAQIWQLWNRHVVPGQREPDPLCEPISLIGLFQSAVVIWSYARVFPDSDAMCDLDTNAENQQFLDLAFVDENSQLLENWIKWGGVVYFNALPLCQSSLTGGLLLQFEGLLIRNMTPHGAGNRFLKILKHLRNRKDPTAM